MTALHKACDMEQDQASRQPQIPEKWLDNLWSNSVSVHGYLNVSYSYSFRYLQSLWEKSVCHKCSFYYKKKKKCQFTDSQNRCWLKPYFDFSKVYFQSFVF